MNKKILQAIKDVFPDFDQNEFSIEMRFDTIPYWDSMNSVNFQMSLESIFEIDLSDAPLSGQNTIEDLIAFIEKNKQQN